MESSQSRRLFITDRQNNRKYLIDTGADVSIIPKTFFPKIKNSNFYKLFAANGTPIHTYGKTLLNINLGLRRNFKWNFIIADVSHAIIGADFLDHYALLVDIRKKRLIDCITQFKATCNYQHANYQRVTTINSSINYFNIVQNFKSITIPPTFINKTVNKSIVAHQIVTNGQPIFSRARRLNADKLKAAKLEFQQLVESGICQPSNSPWASPIHLVKKKDGEWRICGDYRGLNAITVPDRYPLPHIQDFTQNFANKKIFSKLDLIKAYYQIPMEEESRLKTAVITPFGLFEFNFMPFGLRNATQTFQRFMNHVFHDFDFVYTYVDDICIASKDEEEHKRHLELVFQRLQKFDLRINLAKCALGKSAVIFLGHKVDANGITPPTDKIEAILNFNKPTKSFELRRFLALMNFYRRFLPDAAVTQGKLQILIKGNKKKDQSEITWDNETLLAFEKCKNDLAKITHLAHPLPDAQIVLNVDASDFAVGAVLHQINNGQLEPLGFYSKRMTDTQKKYSTYDRELLAIYQSVKHFKYMLDGQNCIVYTDHKPIIFAFRQNPDKASPRQLRHLDYIGQFTTDIRHVAGSDNVIADALSRIETITSKIDLELIATSQRNNFELEQIINNPNSTFKLTKMAVPNTDLTMFCDISTNYVRPFIVENLRKPIFELLHNLAHPGKRTTIKMISEKYVWPKMSHDINQWSKQCIACQKCKISRHNKSILDTFVVPNKRFQHINIDLIGPLPTSNNYRYCLTCIDRFSRWPAIIPIEDITAETIAKALIRGWISHYGVPQKITTDQGRQFESSLFNKMSQLLGCQHFKTTPYHPQSNGIIERFHRTLKASIKCYTNANDWSEILPLLTLGLRTIYKLDLNASPAEMLYGQTLRLPGDFFETTNNNDSNAPDFVVKLRQMMDKLKPVVTSNHSNDKHFVQTELKTCKYVFLRDDTVRAPFKSPYDGPYKVLQRNNKNFEILIANKSRKVSIDRLKPAFIDTNEQSSNTSSNTQPSSTTLTNLSPSSNTLSGEINEPNEGNMLPKDTILSKTPNSIIKTRYGRIIKKPQRFVHFLE